jgi:hypothetical protein
LYNVASCWLYLKEYINDARSHERQTTSVPQDSSRLSKENTTNHCASSPCFAPFCFNASDQYTPVFHLRLLISGLKPFGLLHLLLLLFHYSIIPLFLMRILFLFRPFLFTPNLSGTKLGRETRAWCV